MLSIAYSVEWPGYICDCVRILLQQDRHQHNIIVVSVYNTVIENVTSVSCYCSYILFNQYCDVTTCEHAHKDPTSKTSAAFSSLTKAGNIQL